MGYRTFEGLLVIESERLGVIGYGLLICRFSLSEFLQGEGYGEKR